MSYLENIKRTFTKMIFTPSPLFKKIFINRGEEIIIEIVHINRAEESTTEFWFRSNIDTQNINVKIDVHNFEDRIHSDEFSIFEKNQWHFLVSYENVHARQKWEFTFNGTNLNVNKVFNTTVIYKV